MKLKPRIINQFLKLPWNMGFWRFKKNNISYGNLGFKNLKILNYAFENKINFFDMQTYGEAELRLHL